MASVIGDKIIVPIGCSCITQFQLNFFYSHQKYNSQIFDWTLFTPDSLISILDSNFESLLKALENIRFFRPGIVKAGNLPGYYWWHVNEICKTSQRGFQSIEEFEDKIGTNFKNKIKYQIKKFKKINDANNLIFIWSNTQPNLKEVLKTHWENEDFNLTSFRYRKICTIIKNIYPQSTLRFAVRPEITDKEILGRKNVYVINTPISNEYMGNPFLFSQTGIFEN